MNMKIINCENCTSFDISEVSALEFRVQKVTLKHTSSAVKKLVANVKNKMTKMNFNIADSAGNKRELKEQYLKSFAGILIEEVCIGILQKNNKSQNIEILPDTSNSSIDQVDVVVIKRWINKDGKEISKKFNLEIRSSFPFKRIEKVVCSDFDILGAYINEIKPHENSKDFYLRFLFSLEYKEENYHRYGEENKKINYNKTTINTLMNDYFNEDFSLIKDLDIYFVGGATKEMMLDDSVSYFGNMKSETFNANSEGVYRKIKIRNAIDAVSILRLILGVITDENLIKK
jgi:hypothetical protein